jgi:hypothetical protein
MSPRDARTIYPFLGKVFLQTPWKGTVQGRLGGPSGFCRPSICTSSRMSLLDICVMSDPCQLPFCPGLLVAHYWHHTCSDLIRKPSLKDLLSTKANPERSGDAKPRVPDKLGLPGYRKRNSSFLPGRGSFQPIFRRRSPWNGLKPSSWGLID